VARNDPAEQDKIEPFPAPAAWRSAPVRRRAAAAPRSCGGAALVGRGLPSRKPW